MSPQNNSDRQNSPSNIDDVSTIDLSKAIPESLQPIFDEHSAEIGYDASNLAEKLKHGQREGPHPLTIFLLVQWLLADINASPRPNPRFVSPEQVMHKHGTVHDKRTYGEHLEQLAEFGVLEKSKWGGEHPCYALPEDVELAPAFKSDEHSLTLDNNAASTADIYGLWIPSDVKLVPESAREWFENRYAAGCQVFLISVFLTLGLAQLFRLTTFDPSSPAIRILGYLITFGAIAMLVGGIEIAKDAFDQKRLELRAESD